MSRTKEAKYDLHRIECIKRDLYEKCVPFAHRTIPESRKFKSLQFAALITL
jgi:hypothetical protein